MQVERRLPWTGMGRRDVTLERVSDQKTDCLDRDLAVAQQAVLVDRRRPP